MRTITTLDVALLRAGLDAIEAHPEQFDAHAWATRTSTGEFYSLAARVCLLAGHAINWNRMNQQGNATFLTGGEAIPETAVELLGLGVVDAHALFDVELTIPRTREIGERLIKQATRSRGGRSAR
jgi:hypothetical protein